MSLESQNPKRCPVCRRALPVDDETATTPFRPFCSERCKLIDLGSWLDGRYRIGGAEDDGDSTPDESDHGPAGTRPRGSN